MPSSGWTELSHWSALAAHSGTAAACTTQEQLTEWSQKMNPVMKQLNVLVGACRSAVTDLKSARNNVVLKEKQAAENAKLEKARAEAQKKRLADSAAGLMRYPNTSGGQLASISL